MSGIVKKAVPCNAFDVNQTISATEAIAFKNAGYECCIRYLPRTSALTEGNLTGVEIEAILAGDLNLMAVQHVAEPGWIPTGELGAEYGEYAAKYANQIGLPRGINMWLDLEEVHASSTSQDIIDYCHAWFNSIEEEGWIPGIYIGWQVGLSDRQLYDLPFQHYWKSYNCDQSIPTRSWQIVQHTQNSLNGIAFDPNTIQKDNLGDLPIWLSPS